MKYTHHIEIDVPRDKVIELLFDSTKSAEWQPNLVSIQLGEMAQNATRLTSKLRYRIGASEIDILQKLNMKNMPDGCTAIYESNGVLHQVYNRFIGFGDKTRWEIQGDVKCQGVRKVVEPIVRELIRKQSINDMGLFKAFAEKEL